MTQSDTGNLKQAGGGQSKRDDPSRFFCAELSRRAGESGVGTASTGAVWLLLEYPHGWGRRAFKESALPPEVKQFFKDTLARIRHSRFLFIKTDRGRRDARMNLFVVRCRERSPFVVRLRLEKYLDALSIDLSAIASGRDTQGGEVFKGPLFLVCTHGRRDKCCAKFGLPVYNALRESACESVWQASHVGGDRFAGNLVCFPHGLYYAHTTPESALRVVEAYRAGRVHVEGLRGRSCYPNFVQAAEAFVRGEAGIFGVEDLQYLSAQQEGTNAWRVSFVEREGGLVHEAHVGRRLSDFLTPITCQAAEAQPVPEFYLEQHRLLPARDTAD